MTRRLQPLRRLRDSCSGFTLVELLLAISIMAMMLVALFTFVFSMGEIWGKGGESRLFEQHVNAVTRHVESMLRRAALPIAANAAAEAFTVREVRAASGTDNLVGFDLSDGDRLLVWPGAPLPEVECSLGIDPGRGLLLYWQSKLEIDREDKPPRIALVSPFVKRLDYFYREEDTGAWSSTTTLQKSAAGHWRVPDSIKLTFVYGEKTTERTLILPATNGALPLF